MKLSNEIKIGIIVVLAVAMLVYGYNFLKGKDLLSSQRDFYAIYNDIDGLTDDNPVQINGFKIGKVKEILFHPDNSGRIIVHFVIFENQFPIPKNTIAELISLDLLGSKALELRLGDSKEIIKEGDTLQSTIQASLQDAVNEQVRPLKEKAGELIASIDSAVTIVKMILNKETRDNLTNSFTSIRQAIATFEHTALRLDTLVGEEKERIKYIFSNMQSITANIEKNNQQLTHIISNVASITDSLAQANLKQTINNTTDVLNSVSLIMSKIEKGEGSIGMLVNNDSLYRNLEQTTHQLDLLFEDIRMNPGRYVHLSVFGKKEKKDKNP